MGATWREYRGLLAPRDCRQRAGLLPPPACPRVLTRRRVNASPLNARKQIIGGRYACPASLDNMDRSMPSLASARVHFPL